MSHARIRHRGHADVVLNLAQMRDAQHIQGFHIPPTQLDLETAILAGARAEVDSRDTRKSKTQTPHAKRSGLLRAAINNVVASNHIP